MSLHNDLVDEFKRRFPGPKSFTAVEASIQAGFENYDVPSKVAADIAKTLHRQMIHTVLANVPQSVLDEIVAATQKQNGKNAP